ncbi:CPBP family intramembrane glutamic endopeptidase [Paraglaciecola sp.]|uniref:CPBP family intramembrane glutamic endopeptidase n=1 Tax=Paraglaciecola sp. TaxID=1920173 RepID=UPI0030F3A317
MTIFTFSQWVMLALIMAMVVYSLWESDKSKKAVLNGSKTKLKMYKETVMFLWTPTIILLSFTTVGAIDIDQLGMRWHNSIANMLGGLFILIIACAMAYHVFVVKNNVEKRIQLQKEMLVHNWMMPADTQELRWFTLGVSFSAGICEELLFRGFLLSTLTEVTGIVGSIVFTSVMFGLCHVYQGWSNVFRTSVLGLIICTVYLLSDSILIAIALHALLDIYGGVLGFIAHKASGTEIACSKSEVLASDLSQ